MTSGSASERDGAVYVAQDQGFFRKYGLDLSFVQVRNGPVAMSALSSGETQFHWGSVSGANLASKPRIWSMTTLSEEWRKKAGSSSAGGLADLDQIKFSV